VNPPLQLDAIGSAHLDIEQRDVPRVFGQPQQRLAGVLRVPTS
jgi:hypothetical protein